MCRSGTMALARWHGPREWGFWRGVPAAALVWYNMWHHVTCKLAGQLAYWSRFMWQVPICLLLSV
jgi:hypothetical protein